MKRNAKRAEERRKRWKEKKRLAVDQDIVQKRREDIKTEWNGNGRAYNADAKEMQRIGKPFAPRRNGWTRASGSTEGERPGRTSSMRLQCLQLLLRKKREWRGRNEWVCWRVGGDKARAPSGQKKRRIWRETKERDYLLRDLLPGPESTMSQPLSWETRAAKWEIRTRKATCGHLICKGFTRPSQYDVKEQGAVDPVQDSASLHPRRDDWLIYYASQKPGPGQYEPASRPRPELPFRNSQWREKSIKLWKNLENNRGPRITVILTFAQRSAAHY